MANDANDAGDIRRQMAQIRRELHQDVREVVEKAEAVADWQRYIRMYPWVSIGIAFAAGYFVVPKRHKAMATAADVAQVREAVKETRKNGEAVKAKEKAKTGLLMTAWATLSPVVLRLAQGYAVNYLENWLLQQQQQQAAGGPAPPRQPSQPQWPGGMRGR